MVVRDVMGSFHLNGGARLMSVLRLIHDAFVCQKSHCNFYLFVRHVYQSLIITYVALWSCSILTTGGGEGRGEGERGGGWHNVSPGVN